uniref:Uncharacterized protein n=1 Tax=Anguilla anguilla TaxID=7936 RepID=A0A0E9W1D5_ANGAN
MGKVGGIMCLLHLDRRHFQITAHVYVLRKTNRQEMRLGQKASQASN